MTAASEKTTARITSGSGAQALYYVPNADRDGEHNFYGHWMSRPQVALTPQQIEDARSDAKWWQVNGWTLDIYSEGEENGDEA